MHCKLCGCERDLVDAHIIPRSFYRIGPEDKKPTRLVTNVEGRYAQKVPIGVYDPTIVCEDCERRFTPWDNYAADIFLKSWDLFHKIEHEQRAVGFSLPSFNYPELKLFFISILWRAAVSNHPMFSEVDIGPHEEKLKHAILTCDPGDPQFYSVVLQAFDTTEVGILNPHAERFDNIRYYRFYLSHIIAFIKVDSRPAPENFHALLLTPEQPLVLAQKSFIKSPERKIMRTLALADTKKGRTKS